MKATHTYTQSGQKVGTISVKHDVTSDEIIKAVSELLFLERKVNATTILKKIQQLYWWSGENWIESETYYYPEFKEQATELAKKYYPSFF